MNLTFEEACRGVNKTAEINVVEECWQCKGTKAAPGSKPQTCPNCHGTGMVGHHYIFTIFYPQLIISSQLYK